MLFEQLLFSILAFALFVIIFFKMIKNNDTSYVTILIIEAIGILINFMEVLLNIKIHIIFKALAYILSIFLPIIVIAIEKKNVKLMEIINLTKAKIYLFFGNKKLAKKALIHLATKYPNSYYAHKMLAEIYEEEGGMRKAIDEYVQVIDIRKNDYDSYYKIADLLTILDKKDEASHMLRNLIQKKPEYMQATMLLGEILIEQENYKEAVNLYTEGLKYDPTNYEIHYNLGIAYTMLNDFQSAKICYEKAAELNSLLYNAKYSLAEIALIYKEIEEAEKYFIEAIEEEELEADAYFQLAKLSLIKGEKEKAIQYANIAVESNPQKIVSKIKKDPIFIPVIAKIAIPFNIEEKEVRQTKFKEKEIQSREHLEDMFEITRNLSYQDIKLLNKYGKRKSTDTQRLELYQEVNQQQKERES